MINMKHVFTIVYKDALDIKSDRGVLVSVFIIPFIFSLVLPLALVIGDIHFSVVDYIGGARMFIDQLPEQVIPKSIDPHHGMVYAILMYFFIPFFILIPVFVSSMLATTSFTGEKEHKTIEGLLYTPITNKELMLGKILVSGIPSILLTWIAVFIYGIIANVYGVNVLGEMIFPNFSWIMVTFFIAPLIAFLSISLVVAVSQRVNTSKSAQSVSMILVLPIIGFIISQANGVFLFGPMISIILVVVLIVVDIIVYLAVSKRFDSDKLLTK
ncbi:ABC transporter permease subunit [Staphylococcus pseudintermedius]|uniref:ABC transporter permease subunit n=1 Tax=Staphylococcus pseudintermedius TaxID=283734 RepID=UPI002B25C90D|nr:ABC transporter permease subunit [Staphylococcus pseudintermedius]WQM18689.1 ABC transporter permease subunit [Staphylococcus pseudintermedius]